MQLKSSPVMRASNWTEMFKFPVNAFQKAVSSWLTQGHEKNDEYVASDLSNGYLLRKETIPRPTENFSCNLFPTKVNILPVNQPFLGDYRQQGSYALLFKQNPPQMRGEMARYFEAVRLKYTFSGRGKGAHFRGCAVSCSIGSDISPRELYGKPLSIESLYISLPEEFVPNYKSDQTF